MPFSSHCGFCGNRLTSEKQRRSGECAQCMSAGEWLKGRRPKRRVTPAAKITGTKPDEKPSEDA